MFETQPEHKWLTDPKWEAMASVPVLLVAFQAGMMLFREVIRR